MSVTVQLYKWHKRINSTKIPLVGDPHTDFSCVMKEPVSIHNPIIILASNDVLFTYAHIAQYDRYYFVSDVVHLHNNLVEYHLTEDYLGSNKTEIGSTVANIAYASDHYNTFIVDPRIKVSTSKFIQSERALHVPSDAEGHDVSPIDFVVNGLYMVTIFDSSNTPSANGMASVYIMDESILHTFKNWMSNPSVMADFGTYFNGDPLNAIFNIKWIPYRHFASSLTDVKGFVIGTAVFSTTVQAGEVFKRVNSYGIYKRTYAVGHKFKYSDFRRSQPYTTALLTLPGVGVVDVNPSDFVSSDKIYIIMIREDVTGNVAYYIKDQYDNIIQTVSCNVASTIPYGRITTDVQGVANSIGGMAAGVGGVLVGALTGNVALGVGGAAAAGLASAANMALSANKHGTSIVGGSGSRASTYDVGLMYAEFAVDTEDPDDANYIAKFGRPVCETHAINTHSGFVQTINASVSLDADREEIETVNRMLDAGIYYE